jgi:hypothetical protein
MSRMSVDERLRSGSLPLVVCEGLISVGEIVGKTKPGDSLWVGDIVLCGPELGRANALGDICNVVDD